MNKVALLVVIAISVSGTMQAQGPAAPQASSLSTGRPVSSALFEGIALSSDQRAAIKGATADFSAEATKVTGPLDYNRSLDPSKAAEVAKLRDRLTVRIRSILTMDQRAVFDENLARIVARRRG